MTTGVLVPECFEPITLSELDDRAALNTRVERKYVLAKSDAASVCTMLPQEARVLEIGGRRSFRYTSVYFDTPRLDAYRATAYGRRRRFKVRTREYLDSGLLFVEVKMRQGRFTLKNREECEDAESLTQAGAAHVAEYLNAASFDRIDTTTLAPALRASFRRTTFYLPEASSRVTFDTDLSFSTAVGKHRGPTLAFPELAIVETKTPNGPSSLDRLLWSLGIRPARFSKFGTGLAELRPELPHAKWARVMRTRLVAA